MCAAIAACALAPSFARPAPPPDAFDVFSALMDSAASYSMTVDSHEVLGDRSEELSYAFARSPSGVRLHVIAGRGTGVDISYRFGDTKVRVRPPGIAGGLVARVDAHDPNVTSLRGNGAGESDLNVLRACFAAHRSALRETSGPRIGRAATTAIVFEHRGAACSNAARSDREVTADVLFVASPGSGVPLLRKSYAGREIVEDWRIRDFRIESGPRR